ncbi:MAG: hypothetical protein GEV05_07545 [Betaproteobacteria bacterium]|nr:hypothetical protein [Betaproteobacteria bacterium]
MKAKLRYAIGIGLTVISATVAASPIFSVSAGSGFRGDPIVVSLKDLTTDGSTDGLIGATVFVTFQPDRLKYVSSSYGDLQLLGDIFEIDVNQVLGSATLGIFSSGIEQDPNSGTLLDVSFEILGDAPFGPTPVSFRCVPFDPLIDVGAVTDQDSANSLCRPLDPFTGAMSLDYAIPPTTGDVNVLAQTAQVPVSGTTSLALLGLGLMAWMRRKQVKDSVS